MFIRLAQYIKNGVIVVDVLDTEDFALDTITKAEYDAFKASTKYTNKFKEKTISIYPCVKYAVRDNACLVVSAGENSGERDFFLVTKTGRISRIGKLSAGVGMHLIILSTQNLKMSAVNQSSNVRVLGVGLINNRGCLVDAIGKYYEVTGQCRVLGALCMKDIVSVHMV